MGTTVDRELFEQMPKAVAEWMEANTATSFLAMEGNVLTTDVWLGDGLIDATFYFEEGDKTILARMEYVGEIDTIKYEYLLNSNKLNEKLVDAMMSDFKAMDAQIKKSVEDAGYRMYKSHDVGNGLTAYWDVVMTEANFNGEAFQSIWKQIIDFDHKLTSTLTSLGFNL